MTNLSVLKSVLLGCVLSLLNPAGSYGKANYTILVSNVTWPGQTGSGYYVFDATAHPYAANFTITKVSAGNRQYFVTFSRNSSGNYNRVLKNGSAQLNYQLYKEPALTTVLKAIPDAATSETISGVSPSQTPAVIPLTFYVHIPPGQVLAPGTYTDTVTVSVYDTSLSGQAEDSGTITITAQVRAVADLALVASGTSFTSSTSRTLNFGTLSPGQNLGCDLRIRSNIGYTIGFTAQNLGVLKAVSPTYSIPYTMTVRGQSLNLTQPLTTFAGTAPLVTDNNGQAYPIAVSIGAFTEPPAGTYTDVVTVTVTTN